MKSVKELWMPVITTLIATHDFIKQENKNSEFNSIYIVKPKMHGPEEVQFTDHLFSSNRKTFRPCPTVQSK